jgi:hypothetical protein
MGFSFSTSGATSHQNQPLSLSEKKPLDVARLFALTNNSNHDNNNTLDIHSPL